MLPEHYATPSIQQIHFGYAFSCITNYKMKYLTNEKRPCIIAILVGAQDERKRETKENAENLILMFNFQINSSENHKQSR